MAGPSYVLPLKPESLFDLGQRLSAALPSHSDDIQLTEAERARLCDLIEALRSRLFRKVERDPRSLFDLDERLADLMDRIEEAVADNPELPADLIQEVNDYLEAFQSKVDRIAGYWRWQESIADICTQEAERLSARKRAAESRLVRLKNMLLAFMLSRGIKKLEGERASICMQQNSASSLAVDDPLQIAECFYESSLRFTKTELQELIYQLPEGDLRQRLETQLTSEGWQVNGSTVRASISNGLPVSGARLVKGHHVRIR